MKIERRYTKSGQDAYQGLDFRKAVSEIRNPDGSIVFRLEGIEVPSSWSQVASDILTDKLKAGDPATLDLFGLVPGDIEGGLDSMRLMDLMPDLEKQSLVLAINDAWMMLAAIALVALVALLFVRKLQPHPDGGVGH